MFQRETASVDELKPHPRNYRTRTQTQLEHLTQSIREHGLYRNVVIARDSTILAGHGVVEAARLLHLDRVPVVRLDVDAHEPRALKVLIGDNQIAQLADIDDRQLTEMLREIRDSDLVDLLGTGYDAQQVAALLMVTRTTDEIRDQNAADEWVGLPEYESAERLFAVVVLCKSDKDRQRFFDKIGARGEHISGTIAKRSIRWPLEARADRKSKVFA